MAADAKGRDTALAAIYITGAVGYAPVALENVITKDKLGAAELVAPAGFQFLGLRTEDGGPEESAEAGDAIKFLETGFELSGEGEKSVAMTLAQTFSPAVREFINGVKPDANGVIEVGTGTRDEPFILLMEAVYKNGDVRRQIGVARISEGSIVKEERGKVQGASVTIKWMPHEMFNNAAYWEAVVYKTKPAPVEPAE